MVQNDSRRWLLYVPGGLFIGAGALGLLIAVTLPLYSAAAWLQDHSYRMDLAVAGGVALLIGLAFLGFMWRDLHASSTVKGRVVLKYYNDESPIIAVIPDGQNDEAVRDFAVSPEDYEHITYGDRIVVAYSPFLKLVRRIEVLPALSHSTSTALPVA